MTKSQGTKENPYFQYPSHEGIKDIATHSIIYVYSLARDPGIDVRMMLEIRGIKVSVVPYGLLIGRKY